MHHHSHFFLRQDNLNLEVHIEIWKHSCDAHGKQIRLAATVDMKARQPQQTDQFLVLQLCPLLQSCMACNLHLCL